MSLLDEIQTARRRLGRENPREWIAESRDKTPADLSSHADQARRLQFLRESLADDTRASLTFERILAGNELQDVNYLARGARAARSVARIAIRDSSGRLTGWGTGFLIAPGVLLTNNHVLAGERWAARSEAQFGYERDVDGELMTPVTFSLEPSRLFFTHPQLDFTVVAVSVRAQNADATLDSYSYLPLVGIVGKIAEGEWLTIVQHPNGEQKQVAVRENRFVRKMDDVIWYTTDTVGGSSGSPVFNNDWFVVALHHSGVPEEKNGRMQTVDGRDYDPARDRDDQIKWIANEGIRVSRIVDTLRTAMPSHALLQPVFNATPANARIPDPPPVLPVSPARPATIPLLSRPSSETPVMSASDSRYPKYVTVGLRLDADGSVSVDSSVTPRAPEAVVAVLEAARKKDPPFDVPFNATYNDRNGFDPDFLGTGAHRVNLPALSPALQAVASKLLTPGAGNDHVLQYHNYSVVMHKQRRFALYSAANVSFAHRFDMSRPTDVWRVDPRIPQEHQVTNFYYKGNKFDRGHLTRREDLEFGGTAKKALQSAADTCHWTNCTPQHEGFNQNKELWQGIERHLLEEAILQDRFDAQVFTGPILEEDDPVYDKFPEIQYPVRFWKVVAVVDDSGKLFATAFILDQSDVIDRLGIEEAVPITAYKTFQVKIAEVERLTGLRFTAAAASPDAAGAKSLSDFDPLRSGQPQRRRRDAGGGRNEALFAQAPEGYLPLETLESIVRK